MAFNDSALPAKMIPSGTVIGIMNPRLMPQTGSSISDKNQQGLTFCIEAIDAVAQIGFSKDFNICTRLSTNQVT